MNFFEAIKVCFVKYVEFSGRASRSEYWLFALFIIILGFIADIIDSVITGAPYLEYGESVGPVNSIVTIATILPSISVSVRRLHDVDRSGWWLLLILTIVGIIPLLYWACKRSDEGENRFGQNPFL